METWVPELPNDIIHLIINNPTFTNKQVIRLSLVSKEFLSTVQSRSVLIFKWDGGPKAKELEYMISALTRYHNEGIHLDTFKLSFLFDKHLCLRNRCIHLPDEHLLLINQCIHLATANNPSLRNLKIWMPCNKSYVLNQSVFQVESLVQLDLERCSLQQAESMIITWPNLKTLRLVHVLMEEGVFENITRGCPLIETLEINHNKISKFNFKALNLSYPMNLESLALAGSNLRIDVGANGYHKLKSLSLSWTKDFKGDFLINLAHQFPVLDKLHICQDPGIDGHCRILNISSPSLKNMKLENFEELQEASFDVPNIVLFTFYNHKIPKFSFMGNPRGWTSYTKFKVCNDNVDTSWLLKLKEFVAATKMSKPSFGIKFKEAVTEFNIRGLARESADSNDKIIQDLDMTRSDQKKPFSLPFDIEILIGIFRPQRLFLPTWQDCEFPKVLYDHLMSTTFDNMWIYKIIIHAPRYLTLHEEQVSNREKFLELFKGVEDGRSRRFTLYFLLKYG